MSNAQNFKDKRVAGMIGRRPMPAGQAARDPRMMGIKNPAGTGEQRTQLENRVNQNSGTRGPRPSAYMQAEGPGMLNAAQINGPASAHANVMSRQTRMWLGLPAYFTVGVLDTNYMSHVRIDIDDYNKIIDYLRQAETTARDYADDRQYPSAVGHLLGSIGVQVLNLEVIRDFHTHNDAPTFTYTHDISTSEVDLVGEVNENLVLN